MSQSVPNNSQMSFEYPGLKNRKIVADFSGGTITSDAGGMLLREVDNRVTIPPAKPEACKSVNRSKR